MGMSTHVAGIVPPDDDWRKKKAAYDACKAAGVPVPREVLAFFDDVAPDPAGVIIELDRKPGVEAWSGDSASGFEVDLSKLPPHVKFLRFYNAW